jgi:hypothetical protein
MTEEQKALLQGEIENCLEFCGCVKETIDDFCQTEAIDQEEFEKEIDAVSFAAHTEFHGWVV